MRKCKEAKIQQSENAKTRQSPILSSLHIVFSDYEREIIENRTD